MARKALSFEAVKRKCNKKKKKKNYKKEYCDERKW